MYREKCTVTGPAIIKTDASGTTMTVRPGSNTKIAPCPVGKKETKPDGTVIVTCANCKNPNLR